MERRRGRQLGAKAPLRASQASGQDVATTSAEAAATATTAATTAATATPKQEAAAA